MVSNTANTGGAGLLRIIATQGTKDLANNRSIVNFEFWIEERVSSPTTWYGSPIPAAVVIGASTAWSGTFMLDWRPSGLQKVKIADASFWVAHLPDGTHPGAGVLGQIGDTHTVGAGGPSDVLVTVPMSSLTRGPGVRHSGAWKSSIAYVKQSGVWKTAVPYVKQSGVWKIAGS